MTPDHHVLARARVEQDRGLAGALAVQVDPACTVDCYELLGMEIDVRRNGVGGLRGGSRERPGARRRDQFLSD